MDHNNNKAKTLGDVLVAVQTANIAPLQQRAMTSAIKRICEMAGAKPATVPAEATAIRPEKTWANLLSRLRAALRLADVIDPIMPGSAAQDPAWAPLVRAVAGDKRLS